MKSNKEYRCQNCRSLQFKYIILLDHVEIQVKCYSCNAFGTFDVELTPLFMLWKKLEEEKVENF